jgi:hypothetical protein
MLRQIFHILHDELTKDAEDAGLQYVMEDGQVMSGSSFTKDARMLHVLYRPHATAVLRERVDYV